MASRAILFAYCLKFPPKPCILTPMAQLPIDADILPPSDDRIFKTLLTHPDAKPVLIDVVSAAIERPVIDVQVRNIEPPAMDIDEKAERFDVNCTVDGGTQVDVEMHSSPIEEIGGTHTGFVNKYLYYLTDLHSSQKSRGVKYRDLASTYQVTFCEYTVFPTRPGYVSRFSMRTQDGTPLSDQINMVIVELSKLGEIAAKPVEKLTPIEMWSLFFHYAPDPQLRSLLNEIINAKEELSMASALLQEISKDERERAIQRSRRMAETDRISNLLTAEARGEMRGEERGIALGEARGIALGEARGIALGEARGEVRGISNIALNMKKDGMPIEMITRLTGLSKEEIANL